MGATGQEGERVQERKRLNERAHSARARERARERDRARARDSLCASVRACQYLYEVARARGRKNMPLKQKNSATGKTAMRAFAHKHARVPSPPGACACCVRSQSCARMLSLSSCVRALHVKGSPLVCRCACVRVKRECSAPRASAGRPSRPIGARRGPSPRSRSKTRCACANGRASRKREQPRGPP
eukprot:1027303-Pleurochrysis_carterae.AAC.1